LNKEVQKFSIYQFSIPYFHFFLPREKMKELQKLKLFPDEWWENLTPREVAKARAKLDSYASSSSLDTGVKEVSQFFN